MIVFSFNYVVRKWPLSLYGLSAHLFANETASIAKHGTALNAGAHKYSASLGASCEFLAPEVWQKKFHTEDPQLNYYTPDNPAPGNCALLL